MKTLISALALAAVSATAASAGTISIATFNSATNHTEICGDNTGDFYDAIDEGYNTVEDIVEEINLLYNCGADVEMNSDADLVLEMLESEGQVFFKNKWGATRVLAEYGVRDGVMLYEVRKVEQTTQESRWVGRYKIENGKKVKVGMATETTTKITGIIRWNGNRQHELSEVLTQFSNRKYVLQD